MPSPEQADQSTSPAAPSTENGDTTEQSDQESEQLEVVGTEPGAAPHDAESAADPETVVAADDAATIVSETSSLDSATTDAEVEEVGNQDTRQTDGSIESTSADLEDAVTVSAQSIWDAALAGTGVPPYLNRGQAAGLNSHVHLGGASSRLTPIMWGAISLEKTINWKSELGLTSEQEYREHILKSLSPHRGNALPAEEALHVMQIRIGASCDYAQKTEGPIPYVIAAFVPLTTRINGAKPLELHRLQNDSTAWLSPVWISPATVPGSSSLTPDSCAPVERTPLRLSPQSIGFANNCSCS